MIGRVVSIKMNKTVVVLVERVAMHPLYKKTYLQSKRYLVHVEQDLKEGDVVEMIKVKPISKNKHWAVTKIIGRSLEEINEEELKEQAKDLIEEVMPEEKEEEKEEKEDLEEKETKSKKKKEDKK